MPLFRKRLAVFFFIFLSLFTIKNDLLAKPAELKSEESLPVPSSSPSPYLKWAILGVAPAVLFGYGATAWWDQGFSNKMTFDQDEGFFGASSYSGGSDKLGHMFAAYVTSKILNGLLLKMGETKDNALFYSSLTTGLTYVLVEAVDAFQPQYGAGLWDMVFDVGGVAYNYAATQYPFFGRLFSFNLSYWPSTSYLQGVKGGDLNRMNAAEDYSGITYYFDFNAMQLFDFGALNGVGRLPQLSVSFRTQGFSPPEAHPTLEYSMGIGLDVVSLIEFYERTYSKKEHSFLKDIFSMVRISPMLVLYHKKYNYFRIPETEGGGVQRLN